MSDPRRFMPSACQKALSFARGAFPRAGLPWAVHANKAALLPLGHLRKVDLFISGSFFPDGYIPRGRFSLGGVQPLHLGAPYCPCSGQGGRRSISSRRKRGVAIHPLGIILGWRSRWTASLAGVLCRWHGPYHLGGRCCPSPWPVPAGTGVGAGRYPAGWNSLIYRWRSRPTRAGGRPSPSSAQAERGTGLAAARPLVSGAHGWRPGLAGLGRGGYRRGVPRNKKVLSGVFQQGRGTRAGLPHKNLKIWVAIYILQDAKCIGYDVFYWGCVVLRWTLFMRRGD